MSRSEGSAGQTLVHLVADVVQRSPDAEAIVHGERRVSYGQLWHQVSALAGALRSGGLASGDRVALLLDNCPEYVAAYYGVLAAGGAVVALNTAAKSRDLLNWIDHSGASWLIVDARHPECSRVVEGVGEGVKVIVVGEPRSELANVFATWADVEQAGASASVPEIANTAEHLAAIIYTSGTTGKPKGVMHSHKNLYENMRSIQEYLALTEKDRLLNVLPFYYSYGNSVLHTHLVVGGSLVLENSLVYPHKVLERAAAEQVTGFSGVPSTFNLLLSRTKLHEYDLSAMRYMTQAGGPMAPAITERILDELPHIDLFVMYGQTEATARLAYLPPQELVRKMGAVGIPIPRVDIEIRGEDGSVLPPGETGEICACGDNIMMGYWQDPATTAQVLKDGWLHTGDLARRDEDGYIYIVGRSSEMIKSGAHRISPKDIEEVILEVDGVEEVAVVGVPDDFLGQLIRAVVVLSPGAKVEKRDILRHCKESLATYKMPKQIEFTDQLPRTASGKIRRFMLLGDA